MPNNPEEAPTEGEQRLIDLINKMDHVEMCRLWRFAEAGHPYFDTSKPYYAVFKARLDAFGGFTPEISKAIGH
jgi:hypothetical protein